MTRSAAVLLLVVVAGLVSCSAGDRVRMQPIRGQVLYNQKPLNRAMIVFHPLGDYPPGLPKPIAYSDVKGCFKMTTNQPGDGVPAGEYAVTVEQREMSRSGREKIGGKNLLPVRYSRPDASGLRCLVEVGQIELPIFNLTD